MRFFTTLGTFALLVAVCAAGPVPTPEQQAWQELELTMLAHFGINTFTGREWGDGREDPKLFNPTELDCRQWARAAKDGGFKLFILTAKHHDGFCLWPSKYTEHSVKNSSWKNGQGDVVKEFTEACRAEGLKVGLYLSPWDRNQAVYGTDAYNDFYCNQLTELLSNYGPIDEVWLDGACGEGPSGKKQVYDWQRYYNLVRQLQPKALIAVQGPDIRWVGNESGIARAGESSVQKANEYQQDRAVDGMAWHPAECNASIGPSWFYQSGHEEQVKSLEQLIKTYFLSVGRNGVMLLNVPPDRRGLLPDVDVARLKEFGKTVPALYTKPVGRADSAEPVSVSQSFNLISVKEDIRLGERVQAYRIEGRFGDAWRTLARGTVIGHRNLHKIAPSEAREVRLVIEKSAADPRASFELFDAPMIGNWDSGSLTAFKPVTASNVHPSGEYSGERGADDDMSTRWATSDETRACWLEVDLLKPESVGRLIIKELDPRITKFQLEYRDTMDAPWQVALAGGGAGKNYNSRTPVFRARYVRLHILEASNAPSIWEFTLLSR